jgi:hypothetical protein
VEGGRHVLDGLAEELIHLRVVQRCLLRRHSVSSSGIRPSSSSPPSGKG